MAETELHDLSDDTDYAVASLQQQQGSETRLRRGGVDSRKSEADGAEVIYKKDNVTIHTSQFASERISGRLKLMKQGSSLFMTWIPYRGKKSNARLSERDRSLYTIRAVALTDVRSIRRHTPTLGWQYIIIVLSSGLAFPPLYFYSGGVREFLAAVKQHVFLVRSADDANVFIVNDSQDPLQKILSSLELPRPVSLPQEPSLPLAIGESSSNGNFERTSGGTQNENLTLSVYNAMPRKKVNDPARDLSIQVLEKFSLVTRFARETTSQLFRENHGNSFGDHEKRTSNLTPTHYPQKASINEDKIPDEVPVKPDPLERFPSNKENAGEEAATLVGTFELIDSKEFDKLSLVWGKPRLPPLGAEEWATFLDSKGRVTDSEALRKRIFYGGIEHELRKEVWALILGYHAFESTYAEREYVKATKKSEYEAIKFQWQSISPEQAKRFTKFRERKSRVEKDVVRTDRSLSFYNGDGNPNVALMRDILLTYSFYNFDLGYCQGMSDLLSPILYVIRDESDSFWCFVALLERLGPNFNRDQSGTHAQLYALTKLVEFLDPPLHDYLKQNDCLNYFFCFRWILIQFKREFEYGNTMHLWEVLWTHYLSEHMHLYVCVAILKRYRYKIMGEQMEFDTLLKFINELSGRINLDLILRDAEALCIFAGENGAAAIPPGTPPSLPLKQDDDLLL